ncbi:carbonate dehydratase [Pleurocapsa sp. CCALA 161]|uniref:carbonic anhydrase n=1 Tax=Pleurocapsa sp. CCALA 161 TaxID=2107688 RepID=UPI000D06C8D6|nr:carbonic anhydrase [Pleurocapsa sp. CCALA 161]PSB05927.1 carbonate dehydratase [Pleurocapsa sp. CCALA 161]
MTNNIELPVSRRKMMQFGAGFIGTATLASVLGLDLKQPQSAAAKTELTPDQALEELLAGNQRFVQGKTTSKHESLKDLQAISEEQKPFASVLCCADSRSSLETAFDQGFGNLFVVRDAGNVATAEQLGSLEFGSLVLGSKVIMVMGHYSCGAIKAALAGDKVPGSIQSVLTQIEPAVKDFKGQQEDKEAVKKATEANVIYQINKIKKSPVLAELVAAKQLKIVGGYFDFETGAITLVEA